MSLYDKTVRCIRCGFCLEACPTFVLTGRETESPRGRIYLVRSALEGQIEWNDELREHIDSCLGCRACEPACPSGVEYGSIVEMAREQIEKRKIRGRVERFARRALLRTLTSPRMLRASLAVSGKRLPKLLSWALGAGDPVADLPVREHSVAYHCEYPEPACKVFLLGGCIMDVLFSRSQDATIHLLKRHACNVTLLSGLCCGALAMHSGDRDRAIEQARRMIGAAPGDAPIISNSAGCGSAMKEYAHIPGEDGATFSSRVRDISEFLVELGFTPPERAPARVIAYHDACHLAHGQGVNEQPRELLRSLPNVTMVELEESDRCCGSAGIYNITQPKLARELLARKWNDIERTGADTIVTGNPGCLAWIRQAAREKSSPIRVIHTAEALAEE